MMNTSYVRKRFFLLWLTLSAAFCVNAQYQSYQARGELGLSAGTSHYFGDLNPAGSLSPMNYSAGAYYQRYFSNYIGVRLNANYVHLHADDQNNSNKAYKDRNLNFTNNLMELSLQGSFNFFNYAPGNAGHNFTPYVAIGAGAVYTDPFTFDDAGKKVKLRPLGTEGQNSSTPHDGQKYGRFAVVFPLSVGVKQALSDKLNLFAEIGYRFTRSDYLDDVSTTYAGADAFTQDHYKGTPVAALQAAALQSRGTGSTIGVKGWQRGSGLAKDSYMLIQIGLSYNFGKCNCPLVF